MGSTLLPLGDPQGTYQALRRRTEDAIRGLFPIVGQKNTLELEQIRLLKDPDVRDTKGQLQAKLDDTTWGAPIVGRFVLRDTASGKVKHRGEVPLGVLPKPTSTRGFIVNGKEYYVDNLWQTRPGVYTYPKARGVVSQIVTLERNMSVEFNPSDRKFKLRVGNSTVPLTPVMQSLGISNAQLAKSWGEEIHRANDITDRRAQTAFAKLQRVFGRPVGDPLQAREAFTSLQLDPEITKATLGKAYKNVTPEALLESTRRILSVARGKASPDDRDSLRYKNLIGVDDHVGTAVEAFGRNKLRSLRNSIDRHERVDAALRPNFFHAPIRGFFSRSPLSQVGEQTNPIDMMRASTRSTLSADAASGYAIEHSDARTVNPSHVGFVDPLDTPEGSNAGITLQMALGVVKDGNVLKTPLYNRRTRKLEYVDPAVFETSVVAMPDQYTKKGNQWLPVGKRVRVSGLGNRFMRVDSDKVDYVIPSPNLLFGAGSSLVPFLQNTSGVRVEMASRHLSQAIPLVNREVPLVQVATDPDGKTSIEEAFAQDHLPISPVDGRVTSVTEDEIRIKGKDGKQHVVQLYKNYPLTGKRELIDEQPIVKPGTVVKREQPLADSNFSKNGVLALGVNLRTALIPVPGRTYEDALIVSDGAARKLVSQHLHKVAVDPDEQEAADPKRFRAYFPAAYTADQYKNVTREGVVKSGTKVNPGDPLVLGLRPQEHTNEALAMKRMHRSLARPYHDASVSWDQDVPGEVVRVHRTPEGVVKVHVRTDEPLEIGDKLCYSEDTEVLTRRGWVGISRLTLDDEIATRDVNGVLVYQEPLHIDRFPHDGLMYHVRTRQVDLFVTPDHQMYVRPRGEKSFRLIKAREIMGKRVEYQKGANWLRNDILWFELPAVAMAIGGRSWSTGSLSLPMDPWVEFLGHFGADGYVNRNEGNYTIAIVKDRVRYPPLYRRIVEVIGELGYKSMQRPDRILFNSKQLFSWLERLGKYREKKIPEFVRGLSPRQIRLYLSSYQACDGHQGKTAGHITADSFKMAGVIQELCLKAGWAGNIQRRDPETEMFSPVAGAAPYAHARNPSWVVRLVKSKLSPMVNHGHVKKQAAQIEELVPYTGFVYCCEVPNHVLYVRRNGKPVFCGNTTRHGIKGVVVDIRPDGEMPRTKEGPIEMAINPHSVGARMSIGQIYELAVGKMAKKIGKPIKAPNFAPDTDYGEKTQEALDKLGIDDEEEVTDPSTDRVLGKATVGYTYVLKQRHQVDRKMAARVGGPGFSYDVNRQPKGGGTAGGQSLGGLGNMALLAYGSRDILRESLFWKTDANQADELWRAVQLGQPLPPPRLTFAHKKFEEYLKGLGVKLEKKGTRVRLIPLTDQEVLESSHGELKRPGLMLRAVDLKPETGGLFDPQVTGGILGEHAAHIKLAEPLPNPALERGVLALSGLKQRELHDVIAGKLAVDNSGAVVDRKTSGALTGGKAVERLLSNIDVGKELKQLQISIPGLSGVELDKAVKKYRYLNSLKKAGLSPSDAYMSRYSYVLPPSMRPMSVLPSGALVRDSLNELYKGVGIMNERLGEMSSDTPEFRRGRVRLGLYQSLGSLAGVSDAPKTTQGVEQRGIMDVLAGTSPKFGWVQAKLLKGKQDLSARSIITPDPDLMIDEIGVPRQIAATIYRPFVVRELTRLGHGALEAQEMIKASDPTALRALEKVMEDRPVIMKRDPVLHKYGVQAFKAKLTGGRAIRIPPLITESMGADFDGDQQKSLILLAYPESVVHYLTSKPKTAKVEAFHHQGWWDGRRTALAARFKEQIVGNRGMGFFVVDLEDVPHGPEIRTKGHITFYEALPDTYVVGLDESTGLFRMALVTSWSVHRDREVEIVTLRSGRQILTDDDPRGVYGLDDRLEFVRRRPSESQGVFVPAAHDVSSSCPEDVRTIRPGEPGLHPGIALDARFGYLCGIMVGDGWEIRAGGKGRGAALANVDDGVAEGHVEGLDAIFVGSAHVGVCHRKGPGYGPDSRRFTVARPGYGRLMGRLIGHGARNKHLPPMFHRAPLEFRKGLLAGLLDTDGSVSISRGKKKPQRLISYTTVSLRLAYELVHLLRTLEVRATITASRTPKGGKSWLVGISTVDMYRLGPLPLCHSVKARKYAEFLAGPAPAECNSYAQHDIVPAPRWVLDLVMSLVKQKEDSSYWALYDSRKRGFMSRYTAHQVLKRHPELRRNEKLRPWIRLVDNTSVWWDPVMKFEKTGIRETGYDLTVPGYETFMSVGGVILSNTVSLYVPVSGKSVEEARKMFPSENLLNPASGKPAFTPKNEMAVGLYRLSQFGKPSGVSVKTFGEAVKRVTQGDLGLTDVVEVGGRKTTAGRLLVYRTLPQQARDDKLLYDPEFALTKGNTERLLAGVAKKDKAAYAQTAQSLMNLGNAAVYDELFTISMKDLRPDKVLREKYVQQAQRDARKALASSDPDREAKALQIWADAGKEMMTEHERKAQLQGNRLLLMSRSGVKPTPHQFQEMTMAPMLFTDPRGVPILEPVTRSYGEGLDTTGYWLSAIGARTGIVQAGTAVREPGYMNKQMINTVGNTVVVSNRMPDAGISMDTDHPDVVDRYLVEPVRTGKMELRKGTLLTAEIMDRLKNARIRKVVVASPLTSPHGEGISAKSYGLMPDGRLPGIGDNLGVIAGQSIGERLTQIMLSSKHGAGVYQPGKKVSAGSPAVTRIKQLLQIPEEVPDAATLAVVDGKIAGVKDDPAGGFKVTVSTGKGEVEHYVPQIRKLLPEMKVGARIRKGKPLTDGSVDLRELMDVGGVDQVRKQIVTELDDIFRPFGVRRRNLEILARGVTNTGVVTDPGDASDILKGQNVTLSWVDETNRTELKGKRPIRVNPILTGIKNAPLANTEDWLAKMNHERLRDTVVEAALQGHVADISGYNPFSAAALNERFGEGISGKPGAY